MLTDCHPFQNFYTVIELLIFSFLLLFFFKPDKLKEKTMGVVKVVSKAANAAPKVIASNGNTR